MKNLVLVRHGKSSWENQVEDFERDLILKGVENSYKVGQYSSKYITQNTQIWSSFAKRAHQTAKIFMQAWNLKEDKITTKLNLYTFNVQQLEEIVKSAPNDYQQLIIFGHNGAITDFVNKFGDVYIENVPTSGFVSIQFATHHWKTIEKGKTNKIIFPSHL